MGLLTSVMIQPPKKLGARAEGEHREVRHLQHILSIAAIPGQQHAAAAVCIRELTAHLAKLGRLHVTAAVEAEDRAGGRVGDGAHHDLLRMPPRRLPLGVRGLLLLRSHLPVGQRVQLDGDGPANKLHALAKGLEAVGEDGVLDAQVIESVGHAATVAGVAETFDALKVGDVELADFLFGHGALR